MPHEFSSTQITVPGALARELLEFGARIQDSELAEEGRELEPHITVKFGLHTDDSEDVRQVLQNEPPISVTFGKTAVFSAPEYDVLIVEVDSADLVRINKLISASLDHTDTHAGYQPHATIAYLQPGLGEEYAGNGFLEGKTFDASEIFFSSKNRGLISIPLIGKKSADDGEDDEEDGSASETEVQRRRRLFLLWWWNKEKRRYVNRATGEELSRAELRQYVLATLETARDQISDAGGDYNDGDISLTEWQLRVADTVKNLYTALAILAAGGVEQVTPDLLARLALRTGPQYRYLRQFALDIERGDVSPAQLISRSTLYAMAGWSTFENVLRDLEIEAGMAEEMRVLEPGAAHCADCPPIAGFWAPIGSLPDIGDSACQVNCLCEFQYR